MDCPSIGPKPDFGSTFFTIDKYRGYFFAGSFYELQKVVEIIYWKFKRITFNLDKSCKVHTR